MVVAYFTYQQTQLSHKKREDELYDRRFAFYKDLYYLVQEIIKIKGTSDTIFRRLATCKFENRFLFGKDIEKLLEEIEDKMRGIGSMKHIEDESKQKECFINEDNKDQDDYKQLQKYFYNLPLNLYEHFYSYLSRY